ncbi:hypothetical protein MNV49_000833, partial [Pseudohyphozyma bogoriensis]
DIHVLTNGWPKPTSYHAIVGHEIIGTVVRAGEKSGHKVGDRVGFGAQAGSCGSCDSCHEHLEQYCVKGMLGTYQGVWEDGTVSQGGYANFFRGQGHLAIPVPENIPSDVAAPLMCAGVTVYSPLKRFHCGPGKKVGVVGIGGLGHLGLQFAKAMGAETFALSHSANKQADAEKLGVPAENFIITKDIAATAEKWARSLDIILCTSFQSDLPIESLFFKVLKPQGALVLVGLPEEKLPAMYGQQLVGKGLTLAGSLVGGTDDLREMLAVASEKDVRPWITVRPLEEASQVVKDMDAGKARYRYVLDCRS